MFNKILAVSTLALCVAIAPVAYAGPKGNSGNPSGGVNPGGQNNGFTTATYTEEETTVTQTEAQFMGMSQKTPPNEKAAASKGVRTETTTTTKVENVTYSVNGPYGELKNENYSCDNCNSTEVDRQTVSETSNTEIDGPGNSNH